MSLFFLLLSSFGLNHISFFCGLSVFPCHIPLQEETETALLDARGLQEHLEASEHLVESLRRELRELGTRQGHTHTELQQARLQAAQLALQLSEENLAHREELSSWALEREALKHASEVRKPQHMRLIFFLCLFLLIFLYLCRSVFFSLSRRTIKRKFKS